MKKILITEDDAVSRKILVDTVESMGHIAIQSSNGLIALDILFDNPDINLLIADMMMPKMDGRTLIQVLRGQERFSDLPIIIISGVIDINEVRDLLDAGVFRFMPKPVKTSDLEDYINRCFSSIN